MAPRRGADGAVDRPRAVAELDAVDALPRPAKLGVTHADTPPGEVFVVAHDDLVVARVRPQHVERPSAADSESAPLSDREVVETGVPAHGSTCRVHDVARALVETSVPLEEPALALPGQEAQVLTRWLGRHRQVRG